MDNRKELDLTHIAGAVVVYNTDYTVINNINTYLNQVSILYVIDNSDKPNRILSEWAKFTPSVRYSSNYGNLGIANALNTAATNALQDGYSYLLTMDDDSRASVTMINEMINFLNNYPLADKVGIVSVAHTSYLKDEKYRKVDYTMTSGNLLNLYAFKKIGKFNEQFFIDHVDHEYNLRLTSAGYSIIELCKIKFDHKLGTVKHFTIMGRTISYISHSPIRFFYHVRNGVYIMRKYMLHNPIKCFSIMWLILKEFAKSFLYEEQRKLRFIYFLRAVQSGWQGKLGKISE